jgi:hypothetical protein
MTNKNSVCGMPFCKKSNSLENHERSASAPSLKKAKINHDNPYQKVKVHKL